MKKITSVLFAALFLLSTPRVFGDAKTFNISPELDRVIQQGLHELYNLNFDKALALFDSIKDQENAHPMVSFGVASCYWWKVSALVLEPDENESKPFLEAADHCIKISEKMIDEGDPTGEGHLVLGGALGLVGRWEATNRNWMSAYFKGKRAYKLLTQAQKINPELYDANMGLGIFDYYVATLPMVVRALTPIGKGGDPNVGLNELRKAASDGTYANTPSRLFLCQILSQVENKPEKGLEIILDLKKDFPESPFINMLNVITLYNMNSIEALEKESKDLLDKTLNGTYPKDYLAQAYFAMALPHFKVGKWDEAAKEFSNAITKGKEKDPFWTWSHLYLGYSYDAMGKREEAKREYEMILKLLRRWGSHDNAKRHLSHPFKPTDKEVKKLEL